MTADGPQGTARARRRGGRHYARTSRWRLTPAETAVADSLLDGLGNAEIAARLAVSYKAVDGHLRNIYAKLEVKTRLQAALKWQAYRLAGRGAPAAGK